MQELLGKIQGSIENGEEIGKIYKNSPFGVYGKVENIAALNLDSEKEMEVALREEIKLGEATILCTLDNKTTKEYKIEIEKIYLDNNYDNKSMRIKITDDELLEKTGGIIQGMSGAAIIQNRKVCRMCNKCVGKYATRRVCCIWRYDVKANALSRLKSTCNFHKKIV